MSSMTSGTPVGNVGSSCVSTVNGVLGRGNLAQHRLDHHARRTVALDDGNQAVGDALHGRCGRHDQSVMTIFSLWATPFHLFRSSTTYFLNASEGTK